MKKKLAILISAVMIASFLMVPSFADMPDGVRIDMPDGWTMTEEMRIRSHSVTYPDMNYSYDVGRVQVEEDSIAESLYISYYVDSGLKDLPVPEIKSEDDAMAFYESISETMRHDMLAECELGHLIKEFKPIKMQDGEDAVYAAESDDGMAGIIIQPMGDGLLRVFNIDADTESVYDKLLAAAYSYGDSNMVRHNAASELDAQYEKAAEEIDVEAMRDKKSNLIFILIIAAIVIVVVFFTTRHNYHKHDNRTYRKYEPDREPGRVPVEVTCSMCGKKFIVFTTESQVEMTRKNSDLCPECKAPIKKVMKLSALHSPWR